MVVCALVCMFVCVCLWVYECALVFMLVGMVLCYDDALLCGDVLRYVVLRCVVVECVVV